MGKLQGSSPFFVPGPPAEPGQAYAPIVAFLEKHVMGDSVIDLGGGRGAYALALSKLGKGVTVVDIDPLALNIAKANGLQTHLTSSESELNIQSADTVILIEVLEHVENPAAFLKMAIGLAKKRLLITVPCSHDFNDLFPLGVTFAHIAVSDHLHHYSDLEISELMNGTGKQWRMDKGDFLFPHAAFEMIHNAFKYEWLGELLFLPLRLMNRFGLIRKMYPQRYYVVVEV